ncbi:metal/formaldehyde-sensitive transcriptional repressor [Rhodomicrobium sp. Az07]|uniref:metal/formaldehyde-sensitive transcriptional repressor n=1 Tax=Rhodomicrobium sp. Az07 TaxID=2839034 RepID=UPI001BE65BA0|nr:metal/formaldehyde-sensitive transcriptional repressor [Rhodomicrobium sp. Az07]MBT3070886.1 metal/formaldehyde-sensitive transcriptional repressor [Rhodomicrobium sp. Az07]
MAHTTIYKEALLARVRRLKGQFEGVERALEAEAECAEVLRQLASIRGALAGLTSEIMEGHVRGHILAADTEEDRSKGAEELIQVIRTYMK